MEDTGVALERSIESGEFRTAKRSIWVHRQLRHIAQRKIEHLEKSVRNSRASGWSARLARNSSRHMTRWNELFQNLIQFLCLACFHIETKVNGVDIFQDS